MGNYPLTVYNGDGLSTLLTVEGLTEYLDIGKNKAYSLLKKGDIKGSRIGSVWRMSQEAVDMYIRESSGIEETAIVLWN